MIRTGFLRRAVALAGAYALALQVLLPSAFAATAADITILCSQSGAVDPSHTRHGPGETPGDSSGCCGAMCAAAGPAALPPAPLASLSPEAMAFAATLFPNADILVRSRHAPQAARGPPLA